MLAATRIGMLLAPLGAPSDTVPISFNPSVRLQVRQRPGTNLLLGTAAGIVFGAGMGAVIPDQTPVWGDGKPGPTGEIVVGGLSGAFLGWTVAWVFGPQRWEEVPLGARGIASAPLGAPTTHRARFSRAERWTTFATTEEDFGAFFWAHRDSLQPLEGLWELQPVALADFRVAIVRDSRYQGWEYVAIRLPPRRAEMSPTDDGTVWFVLRPLPADGAYEMRYVEGGEPVHAVILQSGVLRIRLTGEVQEWWKLDPTPG